MAVSRTSMTTLAVSSLLCVGVQAATLSRDLMMRVRTDAL
jgi:hypothetical protein